MNNFENYQILLSLVSTDVSLLTRASHAVQQALSREDFCEFQSTWVMIITWHNVSTTSSNIRVSTHFVIDQLHSPNGRQQESEI